VLVISIFLFGGIAFAQDFSADMVFTIEDEILNGKIFVTEEKQRMEIIGDTTIITITRMDKNVVWILMPEQKMYIIE